MPQYECPGCRQLYAEAGYCPYAGQRLSLAPEPRSQLQAVSASDTDDDGLMDACSGTLDVSATYVDESGTQTIDLGGNFDVTRASGS